jgi:hypothetical protein
MPALALNRTGPRPSLGGEESGEERATYTTRGNNQLYQPPNPHPLLLNIT